MKLYTVVDTEKPYLNPLLRYKYFHLGMKIWLSLPWRVGTVKTFEIMLVIKLDIKILYSMCLHTTVCDRHGHEQQYELYINKVYQGYINHINLNELFILRNTAYNYIQE